MIELIDEIIAEDSEWRYAESEAKDSRKIFEQTSSVLKKRILVNLKALEKLSSAEKLERRYEKFREMGRWV